MFCFLSFLLCQSDLSCLQVAYVLSLFAFLVAARHILCEKQGKINEAYKKLQDGWLGNGDKVPPAEFAKVNFPMRLHMDSRCQNDV